MASISAPIPQVEGPASEQASPTAPGKIQTANELSGYRASTTKENDVQKCHSPISDNVRKRIRMSQDLSIYSNSEYVYAIFPSAVAFFLDKGRRKIVLPKPLSMIFTIPTHCLNTTATNNYSIRTKGQWFCLGSTLIGSSPLAPLVDFDKKPDGPNPLLAAEVAPETFYQSLVA